MRPPYPNQTTSEGTRLFRFAYPALFACSLLTTSLPAAEIVAELPPVGVLVRELPVGLSGISFPIIAEEISNGLISANDTASITVIDSAGAIAPRLEANPSGLN